MKKLLMVAVAGVLTLSSCDKAPEIAFSASSTDVEVGDIVSFTNSTEKGNDFVWDFGDGTQAEGYNATHVYWEAGTYTVTLNATNKKGNLHSTMTTEITVSEDPHDAASRAQRAVMDSLADMLVGEWTFSTYDWSIGGCLGGSSGNFSGDYISSKVEILADGSAHVTDDLGNYTSGDWWMVTPELINVDFGQHKAESGSNTTSTYLGGEFEFTVTASKLTFSRVEVTEQLDQNFQICEEVEEWEFVLNK